MDHYISKQEWKKVWDEFTRSKVKNTTVYLFVFDIVLLVLSFSLRTKETILFTVLSFLLLLLVFIHLYLIMHEATHQTVSAKRLINDSIGHFCGWFILLPFLPRQRNHLLHHIWTAHPGKDPENKKLIENFSVLTDDKARKMEFIWKSWLPLIAFNHIRDTWRSSFNRGDKKESRHQKEVTWSCIYIIGYGLLTTILLWQGLWLVFISWFFPAWIFFLMFIELVNLPHHAEAPLLSKDSAPLPLWQQHTVSHNCGPVSMWSTFIILNFNLHIAHHLFPTIPWYDIPKVQKRLNMDVFNKNEFSWAFTNRRRPLLQIMGHFFDKRKKVTIE